MLSLNFNRTSLTFSDTNSHSVLEMVNFLKIFLSSNVNQKSSGNFLEAPITIWWKIIDVNLGFSSDIGFVAAD